MPACADLPHSPNLQDHDDPFPIARDEPAAAVASNVPAVPRWRITGGTRVSMYSILLMRNHMVLLAARCGQRWHHRATVRIAQVCRAWACACPSMQQCAVLQHSVDPQKMRVVVKLIAFALTKQAFLAVSSGPRKAGHSYSERLHCSRKF